MRQRGVNLSSDNADSLESRSYRFSPARAIRSLYAASQHLHGPRKSLRPCLFALRLRDPADVFLLVRIAELFERGPGLFLLEQFFKPGRNRDGSFSFVLP